MLEIVAGVAELARRGGLKIRWAHARPGSTPGPGRLRCKKSERLVWGALVARIVQRGTHMAAAGAFVARVARSRLSGPRHPLSWQEPTHGLKDARRGPGQATRYAFRKIFPTARSLVEFASQDRGRQKLDAQQEAARVGVAFSLLRGLPRRR